MAASASSQQQQPNNNTNNSNNNFDLPLPRVDFDKTEIVASTKWMRLETLSYLVPPPPQPTNNDDGEIKIVGATLKSQSQPKPQIRKWDRVVRTTKHSETSVDAVVILATLRHSIAAVDYNTNCDGDGSSGSSTAQREDEIVCVKQYRPPVNGFTLELPAGLIDLDDVENNNNGNEDDDNNDRSYDAAVLSAALREFTEETGFIGTITGRVGLPTYLSPGLTNECACLVNMDVDMTNPQNCRVYNNYKKGIHGGCSSEDNNIMEESERERQLTTVLFPKIGLLAALHEYVHKEKDVKLFNGLYSLAVGMSITEKEIIVASSSSSGATSSSMSKIATTAATPPLPPYPIIHPPSATSTTATTTTAAAASDFPLVQLHFDSNTLRPTESTVHAVTSALRTSGFLLIQSPTLLPLELQRRALHAAKQYLTSSDNSNATILSNKIVRHPTDPKVYVMLEGMDSVCCSNTNEDNVTTSDGTTNTILCDLNEWYKAMRQTRTILLHSLSIGLGMSSSTSLSSSFEEEDVPPYFNNLHKENNDALRLIKYFPGNSNTGNRCKEHSDYGTLTLLLNDGVGGLEAHVNGSWKAVPYVEGSIVVNIGSLLSEWTRQELKATLHRVAGPASVECGTDRNVLMESVKLERVSIAYFADPDANVSVSLSNTAIRKEEGAGATGNRDEGIMDEMSVSEYIRWRSGGRGSDRSGVAFTSLEESRLGEKNE